MKTLFLMIMMTFFSTNGEADIVVNSLYKYGPNGYKASGTNSTQSSIVQTGKNKFTTTNTTTNGLSVSDRYDLVVGAGVQYVPSSNGIAIGIGYYMDKTTEMSLGYKF